MSIKKRILALLSSGPVDVMSLCAAINSNDVFIALEQLEKENKIEKVGFLYRMNQPEARDNPG